MESFGGSGGFNNAVTKKRSTTIRRPRQSSQPFLDDHHGVSVSVSVSVSSPDETTESGSLDGGVEKKEVNLNATTTMSTIPSGNKVRTGGNEQGVSKVKEISELVPKSSDCLAGGGGGSLNGGSAESRLRKVKLKVGGVTHTIHAKSSFDGVTNGEPLKPPRSSHLSRHRQKSNFKDNYEDKYSPPESGDSVQGAQWNKRGAFHASKEGSCVSSKQSFKSLGTLSSEPTRKSKRVPKKRVFDGESDEDNDDEIQYLERLKRLKASVDFVPDTEPDEVRGITNGKKHSNSKASKNWKAGCQEESHIDLSRRSNEARKKLSLDRGSEDIDFVEEEAHGSDAVPESRRREPPELADGRKEISLTTRQRALQSGRNNLSGARTSFIEFPDGLPPAPPRRQKEKLSDVEQQLKKAEAAQRRRQQVEKAARESEAEAIRKILGQDSSRKKREDKLRKRRDELAQERAAKSLTIEPNMVRWSIGPTGTVVTFHEASGLPNLFNSKPCSYPPPREKCAGPSCTNTYKYRDSKSNLPLCSLQCYRAVQQDGPQLTTC